MGKMNRENAEKKWADTARMPFPIQPQFPSS